MIERIECLQVARGPAVVSCLLAHEHNGNYCTGARKLNSSLMPLVLGSAVPRSIVALMTHGHLLYRLLGADTWKQRWTTVAPASDGGR